jgi:ABC-2 type transport system ATP-binding protein
MRLPFSPARPGEVEAMEITRRFGGALVLDQVSFRVPQGTVASLIGPNGSGKTTLLRILAGLLTADGGRALVAGAPPGHGRASFVPTGDRTLYWRLTGRQNLSFFGRISGLGGRSAATRGRAAAEALDAGELLGRRVGSMSTGQRRRLAIARAFAAGTEVVLLDEPFADLDPQGCRAVATVSRAWVEMGGTILYATPVPEGGPEADLRLALDAGSLRSGS